MSYNYLGAHNAAKSNTPCHLVFSAALLKIEAYGFRKADGVTSDDQERAPPPFLIGQAAEGSIQWLSI